ncbi:hypothetical protein EDB84DRAFT_1437411 [Lactarius hengduanensis]|nr:hypothetical protein EDB84DRAFT_1437411 [Lactarius hengduanensis]
MQLEGTALSSTSSISTLVLPPKLDDALLGPIFEFFIVRNGYLGATFLITRRSATPDALMIDSVGRLKLEEGGTSHWVPICESPPAHGVEAAGEEAGPGRHMKYEYMCIRICSNTGFMYVSRRFQELPYLICRQSKGLEQVSGLNQRETLSLSLIAVVIAREKPELERGHSQRRRSCMEMSEEAEQQRAGTADSLQTARVTKPGEGESQDDREAAPKD